MKPLLLTILTTIALCSSSWATDEKTIEAKDTAMHVSRSLVVSGMLVETTIDAKDAGKHVGEVSWIMGQIAEVYHFPDRSSNLDIGGKYPNQIFSIYVSSSLFGGQIWIGKGERVTGFSTGRSWNEQCKAGDQNLGHRADVFHTLLIRQLPIPTS